METQEQIKEMVRRKYSEITLQDKDSHAFSCCGRGCCATEVYNIMTGDYTRKNRITIPDDILSHYLSEEEIRQFNSSDSGICRVTVFAEKGKESCCEPGCCSN